MKTKTPNHNRKKSKKKWRYFKDPLGQFQVHYLSHHRGARRRRERARNWKAIWKNNDWNFPNLVKNIDLQIQEVQRVPNKMNRKRPTPRHVIIKMPTFKDKGRILKSVRKKQLVTYEGASIRQSADFSTETF